MSQTTDWSPDRDEEDRIRAVYARRDAGGAQRSARAAAGERYIVETRARRVVELLARHGITRLGTQRILDVGCGSGFRLNELVGWGADPAHLTGIDLVPDRVDTARRRVPASVTVSAGNAASLPYPAASFDIVLQSTVFTSVLDGGLRRRMASDMVRVLTEDGLIVWYDFHVGNPRNPDVRRVPQREIRRLFPDCDVSMRRITLAPPLARLIAPWSVAACAALEAVPFLCTHVLGSIRKARPAS